MRVMRCLQLHEQGPGLSGWEGEDGKQVTAFTYLSQVRGTGVLSQRGEGKGGGDTK